MSQPAQIEEDIVCALEQELLLPATRSDIRRLDALIAEDFIEIGASGNTYCKPDILDALPKEVAEADDAITRASEFECRWLSPTAMFVLYRAKNINRISGAGTHASRRSSIWRKRDGAWQMIFHQGTPSQ